MAKNLTQSCAELAEIARQGTQKISVDISTLPGWSALADKTYDIQIVAKANGYRDSAPSAAVQVEKSAGFVQVFPQKNFRQLYFVRQS